MRIYNSSAHAFACKGFNLLPGMNTIAPEHEAAAAAVLEKYSTELADGGTLDSENKAKNTELVALRAETITLKNRVAALEAQNEKLRILVANAGESLPEPVVDPQSIPTTRRRTAAAATSGTR